MRSESWGDREHPAPQWGPTRSRGRLPAWEATEEDSTLSGLMHPHPRAPQAPRLPRTSAPPSVPLSRAKNKHLGSRRSSQNRQVVLTSSPLTQNPTPGTCPIAVKEHSS